MRNLSNPFLQGKTPDKKWSVTRMRLRRNNQSVVKREMLSQNVVAKATATDEPITAYKYHNIHLTMVRIVL